MNSSMYHQIAKTTVADRLQAAEYARTARAARPAKQRRLPAVFRGAVVARRTGMRIIHGEFGPKVNFGEHHHIHPFAVLKGGFIDYRINAGAATIGTFISNISSLRTSNVNGVFYPGGGLEGRIGPLGIRFDIGDEIVINNGAHNNLRLAFGPYIRF